MTPELAMELTAALPVIAVVAWFIYRIVHGRWVDQEEGMADPPMYDDHLGERGVSRLDVRDAQDQSDRTTTLDPD
jgi:hypothetical protein